MLAQFTPKTINSEKAIYFLSLMSCSVNQLKPHIIHMQKFYAFRFYVEIFFLLMELVGEGGRGLGPTDVNRKFFHVNVQQCLHCLCGRCNFSFPRKNWWSGNYCYLRSYLQLNMFLCLNVIFNFCSESMFSVTYFFSFL